MVDLSLVRDDQNERRTLGTLHCPNGLVLQTLELPWRDNEQGVSDIPEGRYALQFLWSPSHQQNNWHITGVPGRDAIEIHVGNTTADVKGCVVVGLQHGTDCVEESRAAYAQWLAAMKPYEGTGAMLTVSSKK